VLATRPRRRPSAAAASPAAEVGPDALHDGDALADEEADSDYEHDESAVGAKRARDATDSDSFGDVASDSGASVQPKRMLKRGRPATRGMTDGAVLAPVLRGHSSVSCRRRHVCQYQPPKAACLSVSAAEGGMFVGISRRRRHVRRFHPHGMPLAAVSAAVPVVFAQRTLKKNANTQR